MITLEKLKDKHLGKIGTSKRNQYEQELSIELLSDYIKQIRKERNLTQEELGELIGAQRAQISKLENNTNNVTLATILKVFDSLQTKIIFTLRKEIV